MINREQCGQFIDANTDNMVKDWKRLVEIETGSFDKEGLSEAALFVTPQEMDKVKPCWTKPAEFAIVDKDSN